MNAPQRKVAMAIGAHPDDIEFQMAGTLLMLQGAGYEIHYMTVANGNCGSIEHPSKKLIALRGREAREAARIMGAHFHPSLVNDLEVFYDLKTLRRLAAVIRAVKPGILLTHSPADYMEDHTNTCRLAVTAAFARGMPNFRSLPARATDSYDCTVYHSLPHSQTDNLRRRILAGAYVNTAPVFDLKMKALRCHQSQQHWLDASQKLNSYLQTMEDLSRGVGRLSRRFRHAEAWRRHQHSGFCGPEDDPLAILGKDYLINPTYEKNLERGL